MEENKQPLWPKILAFIFVIIVIAGAIFYFAYYQPNKEKEEKFAKERRELKERQDADALANRQREEAEQRRLEEEQRKADSLANVRSVGTIEKLAGRTGQYYVVVASAIDDDLLMDYAQKLSKEGKQVRIIPPFGKTGKFHRLAIDSKDSYADAQATADGLKGGEFGDQLWVVKY